jgi:membrane dipeptidase
LPQSQLIIDALAIPRWDRRNFEDMRAGGLTAVNIICSIWEDFTASMRNIARLKQLIAENSDILLQVRDASDIDRAQATNRTGVILGWQNSAGFGDHLPFVPIFAELGLKVVQITFNTANSAGSGCYETNDSGLTDFGRELVHALNEHRIALDLTHVGDRTASDVVETSSRPVLYSHSCPRALRDHFRNKTDKDMRRVCERGGIVAVATLPHYLPGGLNSTVDDMASAIIHVMNVVGQDGVAVGTDLTPGQPGSFMEFVSRDKGRGRKLIDYSTPPVLEGMATFRDYGNVVKALERKRVPAQAIDKIMGLNLRRYFDDVWAAPSAAPRVHFAPSQSDTSRA